METTSNYQSAHLTESGLIKEAKAFHLKKRLGQHFLVSPEVLQTIANAINPQPGDTVVEVGSGIGFLTRLLCNTGANVVAVDLDREGIEQLQSMNLPNVEILHGDILRFDLLRLQFFQRNRDNRGASENAEGAPKTFEQPGRIKVIGNVPYQITGLIIGHILGELDKPSPWIKSIDNIVLTVQYEVARRIVANPGEEDYSRLSLLIRYFCEPELLEVVPSAAFYPPPRVNSAVVRLRPLATPAVKCKNPTLLRKLIEAGFRQRRKMYRNSISFLKVSADDTERIFRSLNMDPQIRAERLSLSQFAMLADAFNDLLKKENDNSNKDGRSG